MNRIWGVMLSVLFLGGCAFSVIKMPVEYQYESNRVTKVDNLKKVKVYPFKDVRNTNNPKLIMNKINAYGGTTSGGYEADKPLADFLTTAYQQGIVAIGSDALENDSHVILTGELMEFSIKPIIGMWSSDLRASLTVKIMLQDTQSEKILWKDTFIGQSSIKVSGFEVANKVKSVFIQALTDVVDQTLTNKDFLNQLK